MQLVNKKYEKHIFVCVRERKDEESCGTKIGSEIYDKFRAHINKGLTHKYNVSKTLCLGHCLEGPTIAIYPEGLILKKVTLDDVDKIIKEVLV